MLTEITSAATSMASLQLKGLSKLQSNSDAATDFYQASARNKASQCQASLVVKLPVYNEASDVKQLLSSPAVAEEVVSAYYTKLLEDTIGVDPHGPALQLAADAVGVTKSNVIQHTRVLGGSLQVAGTAPQPTSPPGLPAAQVQHFELLQPMLRQTRSSGVAGSQAGARQVAESQFAMYVKRFTYPYNKQHQLSRATPADQQAAAVAAQTTVLQQQWSKMCTSDRRSISEVCPGAAAMVAEAAAANGALPKPAKPGKTAAAAGGPASMHAQTGDDTMNPEAVLELSKDFVVTGKLIQSHLASFASQMSAHLLGKHQHDLERWGLTAADVTAVGQLLQTPALTRLSLTLMYYLYTRYISHDSHLPAQLMQHITAQAQADRRNTNTKRATQAAAAGSGSSQGAAAGDEADVSQRWDLGCQLLLQKKAEEAAKQLALGAAAAAAAAERSAQQQMLLPQGVGKRSRRTAAHARGPSSAGSEEQVTAGNSSSLQNYSRRSSSGGVVLQRQGSNCSSKHSAAGSVTSYKHAVEAAQHQAQLLAAASTEELQSCRLSGILHVWDSVVQMLTRSAHGATFALPILLMSLQVLVDEICTDSLPTWSHSQQGSTTLQHMTAAVRLLLDPQDNYSMLMVLAGSPAAVVVRHTWDTGPAVAADKRRRRLGLSSVVSAAVGDQPSSPSLRRMIHAAGSKGQTHTILGAEAVQLGSELVHTAAAHRMTQLVRRKPSAMAEPLTKLSSASQGSRPAAVSAGSSSTAATLAADVANAAAEDESEFSVPVSPLGMHGMKELLKKPFADVLKFTAVNLQVKTSAHLASEQLRFCLHNDLSHVGELLASPVITLLAAIVRESPGTPLAGSAMAILAMVALSPDGRARLRAEAVLPAIMRFLSTPNVLQKHTAEHALLLVQNLSCDKYCRQIISKAEGMTLLLELLQQYAGWLRQHPEISGPISAILTHLVIAEGDSKPVSGSGLTSKQKFVKAGGIETVCKAIAEWGRSDPPPYIIRLRLLLHEVSHSPQYTTRVQDVALDAGSLSARVAAMTGEQSTPRFAGLARATGNGNADSPRIPPPEDPSIPQPLGAGTAGNEPDYVEKLIKGAVLGTPRMPASERIAGAVLKHGRTSGETSVLAVTASFIDAAAAVSAEEEHEAGAD